MTARTRAVEPVHDYNNHYQPIDDFGEGVSFLLADTVNNDVSLAGKPA